MLPNTGAHTRFCEFHYDGRDTADEKRERFLTRARYSVGRHKRGLANGLQKIGGRLVAHVKQRAF